MSLYYDHGGIQIHLGDCRDILPHLPKVDLCLTDPPYGVGKKYESHEDTVESLENLIAFISTACERRLVTCGIGNIWKYPPADWVLCWWKPNAMTRSSVANANIWEPVLVYGCKGFGRDGFVATIGPQPFDHPCPKPLKLFSWLIDKATVITDTILDPFMGSGTTLVAAKNLGRKAIGVEIEEKYCEIAVQRLAQETLAL